MSIRETSKRVVFATSGILLIVFLVIIGHDAYIEVFGYSAKQIERDLCDRRHLIYQDTGGFDVRVRCSQYLKEKALPANLKKLAVPPNRRLILDQTDGLCQFGTRPKEIEGKLECAPRD